MSDLIARAARALEGCPGVMASALAACRRTGMTEADLAAWLGLPPHRLPGLALCLRPDPSSPTFNDEVMALAGHVRCAAEPLRTLLVQVGPADRTR